MSIKKSFSVAILILCLIFIGGCKENNKRENSAENKNKSDNIDVSIINSCESAIYGVHFEYFIAEQAIGGMDNGVLDGSPIKKGELMTWELTARDFPNNADISLLELEIYVKTEIDKEQLADEIISINAEYGNTYYIILTENGSNGFSVAQSEKP